MSRPRQASRRNLKAVAAASRTALRLALSGVPFRRARANVDPVNQDLGRPDGCLVDGHRREPSDVGDDRIDD
jgi:hypothetical protein